MRTDRHLILDPFRRQLLILTAAALLLLSLFVFRPATVQAAAGYASMNELFYNMDNGTVLQSNGTWFRNDPDSLYCAKSQSGPWKAVGETWTAWSNGSYVLNISSSGYLVRYNCKTGGVKKLKKLPGFTRTEEGDGWGISAVYGKRVYLTRSSFSKWRQWTYLYKLNTKSFKRVKNDCMISCQKGKYFVAEKEYRSDVSPVRLDLYQSTASGLKHIKKLAAHGHSESIVGKKIYYTASPDQYMSEITIYRCNLDGTGRKKLGTVSSAGFSQVLAHSFTSKYCTVYMDGKSYRFTYSTKTLIPE
ncbi:MAG: hypothetical protein IJ860_04370 [Eubacterium sp.]|nr:hypothetical protein [Eubacterium sp.]